MASIKVIAKELGLTYFLVRSYLDEEGDIDKSKKVDNGYRITEKGLRKLQDYKENYISQSEFYRQGILTRGQMACSHKLKSLRVRKIGGTIGWIMRKSDFEEMKRDILERRKIK